MLLVFVTAETAKYKVRELERDAARIRRVHETALEPEPEVRRQARIDVRTRREAQR